MYVQDNLPVLFLPWLHVDHIGFMVRGVILALFMQNIKLY